MTQTDLFNLKEKKIYVLGGSGLIGLKTCEMIYDLGALVINLDIKKIKKKKKYKSIYFDSTKISNSEKKLSGIFKKYGKPDVFINCNYPKTQDWKKNNFSKITAKSLEKNVSDQFNKNALLLRFVANYMKKNLIKGNIIQLSSIYGMVAQDKNIYEGTNMRENMSYAMIKGGILNLIRQMASYYGDFNIKINCISPGGVKDKQNKRFIKNYSKRVPLRRMAHVDEIASVIAFLSMDASSYITGSNLVVDGGWTII